MTIKRICVEKLFGNLNHEITLNDEGITLIHGPNGSGKTTILNILIALKKYDMKAIEDLSFSKIELQKEDQSLLIIEKPPFANDNRSSRALLKLSVRNKKNNRPQIKYITKIRESRNIEVRDFVKHRFSSITDPSILEKIENSYLNSLTLSNRSSTDDRQPTWYTGFFKGINFEFVETQRLLKLNKQKDSSDEITSVISLYSEEIKELIESKFNESAAISQNSERTFPQRLLNNDNKEKKSENEVRQEYELTQQRIKSLMDIGLIESEESLTLPEKSLGDTEIDVISLNLEDVNAKLEVYNDLSVKINSLLSIISSKLRNKKFSISRSDGFIFKSFSPSLNKKDNVAQTISPSLLSSGEQHQIILFYRLIFKTDNSCIFLIDEPEISLHVDWQRKFLTDLELISEMSNKSFLIATHSPQIIGSKRNLAVSLDGGILHE